MNLIQSVNFEDLLSLFVYSFTFLLGLPANVLVLFVYVRKACKRGATPSVVYALNLCLANLALVAWLPVQALQTVLQDWALPACLCPVYSFFLFASLYGSILFLTAVAVGRYLSIAFPISYKIYRRASISCVVSVALWGLVLLHLGLGLGAEGGGGNFMSTSSRNLSVCYENFTRAQLEILLPLRLEMAILLFLVPLAVTAFCTLRCVTLVWRSFLPTMGKRRVLTVALSTLAVFVVCYAPYNASHVVGFILQENVSWRREAMLTSSCNVFLEPVVMLMLSPATSRGFLTRLCGKQSSFSRPGTHNRSNIKTRGLPENKPSRSLPENKPSRSLPENKPSRSLPENKPSRGLPENKPSRGLPSLSDQQTLGTSNSAIM